MSYDGKIFIWNDLPTKHSFEQKQKRKRYLKNHRLKGLEKKIIKKRRTIINSRTCMIFKRILDSMQNFELKDI